MQHIRSAVRATDVSKTYGSGSNTVLALERVSVSFSPGSFSAIMGPSGSGKSTLMHLLAGLDTLTSGSVELAGVELAGLSDTELTRLRREKAGFVFQSFNLLPALTALQNIVLPLQLSGKRPAEQVLAELTTSLGIADRLDHRPAMLSGGEQQRVAIARALITRPDVIFADEPTGALDSRTGANLLSYLEAGACSTGQTIIMVTHDPLVACHAQRVVMLSDGKIAGELSHPSADDVLAAMKQLGA